MRTIALAIALVVGSIVLAWLLVAGTCGLFEATNARAGDFLCGHNAGIILFLYWIAGLVGLPLIWSWFHRPSTRAANASLKCSKCGHDVTFDMAACPQCGFQFGESSRT